MSEYVRKYPNVNLSLLEEIYIKYMKGSIMDYEIAYETAKSQILDHLKIYLNDFVKHIKINEGVIVFE